MRRETGGAGRSGGGRSSSPRSININLSWMNGSQVCHFEVRRLEFLIVQITFLKVSLSAHRIPVIECASACRFSRLIYLPASSNPRLSQQLHHCPRIVRTLLCRRENTHGCEWVAITDFLRALESDPFYIQSCRMGGQRPASYSGRRAAGRE